MALAQQATIKGMFRRGQTWWFRYTPEPGAAQIRVTLGTARAGDAIEKALAILKQAPLERSAEFTTELEAYLGAGLRSKKLSEATTKARRYVLTGFSAKCEASRLSHLTQANIERWLGLLRAEGKPDNSINSYFMHVRAFCSWLVQANKLRENPALKVKLGKLVVRGGKNFTTKDKIREMIANAPDDRMRFILYCGFHAGMRKLEITEARPEWFQLSAGTKRGCIRIQETPTYRPKDKEERTIPLTTEFESFLRGYLATLPQGATWVLSTDKTRPLGALYRIHFHRSFITYAKSQGVRCTLHDMRRSFVSNKLIDDSSLIFKLAKWTGTDVVTLQKHYAHLLADDEDIEAGV